MMPEFGFPAQPRQASIKSLVSGLRDRSDDARVAATTERFADVTRVLDGRVNELFQIEKSIRDLQGYAESIALAEGRATVMQASLDQIRDSAQVIADTANILQTNGTSRDFASLSDQARGELDSIVASLNVSFAGRALFSGDQADVPPIADSATLLAGSVPFLEAGPTAGLAYDALRIEFFNAGGLYDTSLYLGGAGDAPVTEIAPGERVDYGVKANEDPLRLALFNMVVMSAAYDQTNAIPDTDRKALLEISSAGLRDSIGQVGQIQSRLGSAEARIATMKSRNIASEASLTITYNDLAGADAFDAALTLTQLEDQLEVAFSTTARLSNLTLANFR